MSRQYHDDPAVEVILNDIPRKSDGKPVNQRLRDLDRILRRYKGISLLDLVFFQKEVAAEAARYEKGARRRAFYAYMSQPISVPEADVTRPTGTSSHLGHESRD